MGLVITTGSSASGSSRIVLLPENWQTVDQGTWVIGLNTLYFFNTICNNSTAALDDAVTYTVTLTAGTYDFIMWGDTNVNGGIVHVYVDGTEVGTIDWYANPGTSANRKVITGFAVPSSKIQNVQLKMHTKNGASGGYNLLFTVCEIIRTS